jgi:hypothetical protein
VGFLFDGVLAWGAGEGLHAGGAAQGDHDVVGFNLKTEMAEGESDAVMGATRLPASRVESPY